MLKTDFGEHGPFYSIFQRRACRKFFFVEFKRVSCKHRVWENGRVSVGGVTGEWENGQAPISMAVACIGLPLVIMVEET